VLKLTMKRNCLSNTGNTQTVFDLTESKFRSTLVNPDSDSLANRMVCGFVNVVDCDVIVVCLRWCDVILLLSISGFASESMSKLDLLDSWIRICTLNWRFHWIQPESRFRFGKSNMPIDSRTDWDPQSDGSQCDDKMPFWLPTHKNPIK